MRRPSPPLVALAAVQLVQWTLVFLLARSSAADDAGLGLTLLNVLLLLPVALACVYAVASQLGGARLGVFAAAVWALTPFALAPFWDARYEGTYENGFLVRAVGLTDSSAFRVLVALLVATVLAAQAIRRGSLVAAGVAGLVVSLALALDASAVLFLAAPAAALLAATRWRESGAYAIALLPGLVALIVRDPVLPSFPDGDVWGNLHDNFLGVQEFFWSVRILQWLPVAGVIGVARRSIPLALLLGIWFGAYLLALGGDPEHTIGSGTFLTVLVPALPAYLLLAAAIPLLAPPLPAWRPSRPRFLAARR
jgi:hypothetical protein